MNFTLLQAAAAALPEQTEQQIDLWELTLKGGIIMIPLALLSIIAIFVFAERFVSIRKASKVDQNFINHVREYIKENRIDAAIALCQAHGTSLSRMIEKGIKRMDRPLNDIQSAIENVGSIEVSKLEKGLPMLATIAGGAPMLGFLGTVTGMIRAFFNMSSAGNNLDITLLSSGIYEAMVTTVAGLTVGIIAYFGYNYLVSRIEKVVLVLEASTTEFMDML
ncbi:MAG: MotA/TolQ/ExbB proton channel family protein, partial [Prevotellaceae bacterium]|nr:MotA/TolQ/ExbB proton channel family protein [Prevotellaceae bacterium]